VKRWELLRSWGENPGEQVGHPHAEAVAWRQCLDSLMLRMVTNAVAHSVSSLPLTE
jgi:hypothetical protein